MDIALSLVSKSWFAVVVKLTSRTTVTWCSSWFAGFFLVAILYGSRCWIYTLYILVMLLKLWLPFLKISGRFYCNHLFPFLHSFISVTYLNHCLLQAVSLTGIDDPILAGQELLKNGACTKWVIVKMGPKGSILITKSSITCAPGFKVSIFLTHWKCCFLWKITRFIFLTEVYLFPLALISLSCRHFCFTLGSFFRDPHLEGAALD